MSDEVEAPPPRAETGPMQFGDDWPGVFIRGDNALAFALHLGASVEEETESPISKAVLQGLLDTLRSCDKSSLRKDDSLLAQLKEYGHCSLDVVDRPDPTSMLSAMARWMELPAYEREYVLSALVMIIDAIGQDRDKARQHGFNALFERRDGILRAAELAATLLAFKPKS